MAFTQHHSRVTDFPTPDCTIFNYDLLTFLTESGPLIYDFFLGGYIAPDLGGRTSKFNHNNLLNELSNLNPKVLLIPECYVNGYNPDIKKFFESKIRDLGYFDKRLLVYLQKEQNFYYKEIYDNPDWFYNDKLNYRNICYHSLGYNTPTIKEDEIRFKEFKFCKQGFMCETFRKLYSIKDFTVDDILERVQNTKYEKGKLIFYGNNTTSIRPFVEAAINSSNKLKLKTIEYGDESLLDRVLKLKGIGLSMDGLVYNTIRDSEFGIAGVPNIKVTRADDFVTNQNNLNMFDTRHIIQIQPDVFTNFDSDLVKETIEEGYEKYMDEGIKDIDKLKKSIRYHFFIVLLQKFNNVEFFFFDMLMGDKIKDFIEQLDMEVNFNVFEIAANPHSITHNLIENMTSDYIKELLCKFREYFKINYDQWFKTLNI